MQMRKLWLMAIPPWLFVVTFCGAQWIEFCMGDSLGDARWWSFPAWMTGGAMLAVLLFAGLHRISELSGLDIL